MESAYSKKINKLEVDKIFSSDCSRNSAHRSSHQGLKSHFFQQYSTAFCAELLAHPLDIVIPYCPVDGKCLFSKITKSTAVSKKCWPSPCGSLYNYYWIRIFLFLQIASISQLQYGCGPNIYQMCKYFGIISSTVENIEVLWSAGALQKNPPCTVIPLGYAYHLLYPHMCLG